MPERLALDVHYTFGALQPDASLRRLPPPGAAVMPRNRYPLSASDERLSRVAVRRPAPAGHGFAYASGIVTQAKLICKRNI